MSRTVCPQCQSTELKTVPMEVGPHYAKRSCVPFGHFVEWVARPRELSSEIPPHLLPLIVTRGKPVSLRGTEKQVAAARALRANMIGFANRAGREDYTRLLVCIEDASWFLANKGLFPPEIRWPRTDQLASVETGAIR